MKDIKGYEGLYAITEDGRVWSYKKNKFIERKIQSNYSRVNLYKDGITKYCYVHRLVAEAFLPNPNNLPQVNHKDENKSNNNVNNLEWCTGKYNCNHGTRIQRISTKLKRKILCVELNQVFNSLKEASAYINKTSVCECLKGRCKTAGGYHWRYV